MADPYYADGFLTLYGGDCRAVMAEMPAESVHCVVTSPPYWGLRDYGTDGQLGLEATPEAYVANMVDVFREVRRVLRDDGTLWLNLGDSYARAQETNVPQTKDGGAPAYPIHAKARSSDGAVGRGDRPGSRVASLGLKPKDLVGIPWRVAFALQADGWYLRSDIIWSKPNPMPESVTDRPTKAHEYLFLLTKSPRYYYDAEAIKEPASGANEHDLTGGGKRWPGIGPKHGMTDRHKSDYEPMTVNPSRNIRSVWTIATEPYPGAHFATFPRKLVEPCVKAGSAERVCGECGDPWRRVVERGARQPEPAHRDPTKRLGPGQAGNVDAGNMGFRASKLSGQEMARWKAEHPDQTTGWVPTCKHDTPPVGATVIDPFAGSGTTLLVAQSLGRKGIGIDLNPEYLEMAVRRGSREFGRGKVTEIAAKEPDEGLWGL